MISCNPFPRAAEEKNRNEDPERQLKRDMFEEEEYKKIYRLKSGLMEHDLNVKVSLLIMRGICGFKEVAHIIRVPLL